MTRISGTSPRFYYLDLVIVYLSRSESAHMPVTRRDGPCYPRRDDVIEKMQSRAGTVAAFTGTVDLAGCVPRALWLWILLRSTRFSPRLLLWVAGNVMLALQPNTVS